MKRTRLKPSKRARARRSLVKALDADCRRKVFERDDYVCQRCGTMDGLQWSHLLSRRYYVVRWEPDNSQVLCAKCHMWWTHNPILAVEWFRSRWEYRYQTVIHVFRSGAKPNLKQMAKKL